MKRTVAISHRVNAIYVDKKYDFRPSTKYPEYMYEDDISPVENYSYDMVREALYLYGLDKENYGKSEWNPFKDLIMPGDKVVIKPNLVMDFNPSGDRIDCLFTQPCLVAAVIDYVTIALKGKGEIVIGDAPMQECNFEKLVIESGYDKLIRYYKEKFSETEIDIRLKDFRGYISVVKNGVHYGDENSNTQTGITVDLGMESEFSDYASEKLDRLRINSYNPEILKLHHNEKKHEYLVNADILNADVIINMPKPKTHRKAGVTIALKNLVGINVRKEYLPHHCDGDSTSGGDEYNSINFVKKLKSKLQDKINFEEDNNRYMYTHLLVLLRKVLSLIIRCGKDQSWDGSWYGNETISKTITDLNKILLYADSDGVLHNKKQRNIFIVADMIVSGENEGPVEPTRKEVGMVAVGDDPVCFDEVIATLMGMDVKKIPTLQQARKNKSNYCLTEIKSRAIIISNESKWNGKSIDDLKYSEVFHFIPAVGWIGHIEKEK